MPTTFVRVSAPMKVTAPKQPAPLITRAESGKVQIRSTVARGVTWTEEYPPLPDYYSGASGDMREFLNRIDRYHRTGEQLFVRPYLHGIRTGGTLAVGATGAVNGASQTGTSLVMDGWSAGTVKEGDYLIVAGIPHALWITADATVSAGNLTCSIDPPLLTGSSPADDAVVTLNGLMTCHIVNDIAFPQATGIALYAGLTLTFRESL